ncbi:dihydroxyacetone kinase family protein [Cellulomonas sp. zg-Y908]|uniref:Dihydroxyacetone kinase family protein n=1 Tax=Cellulomonas wangsupingiae TaxID=2968085 RepID=A0ABY5KCT2_9CELL|nr:dihydroxyacetone kinase family protein [Cellulomonas wangsupingiae]MCC2334084.1 dihydroxyacetone kinase family protein [Cellulomonas wangsupingiae]UUI66922.1 dihydroxyacetone kinase family protein [Cellulomonas wangsupingiae]
MRPLADDPARFVDDALDGFVDLYADQVRRVPGGVVRAVPAPRSQVAVVVGGGSGHYPAFCGLVGPGYAHGAVVGNVFTSPSTADAVSVGAAAAGDAGVLLLTGNYAGDVMNFTLARDELRSRGIPAEFLVVTDDVASAPADDVTRRRGIAGDHVVFKVAGAAAAEGLSFDEVVAAARHANDRTRTLGVAFDGCTLPGADQPLFTVPEGTVGLGVGIHGEPGIGEMPACTASELAALLVERLLGERPADAGPRVGVVLNGLGRTKYEELFVLWRAVRPLLDAAGLQAVQPDVGELVTSLDMSGCSLTLVWLDDDLERWWCAPAHTPAYRRGQVGVTATPSVPAAPAAERTVAATATPSQDAARVVDPTDAAEAQVVVATLARVRELLTELEPELGRLDAVAGDGDHGRGMLRGAGAAADAAAAAADAGHGAVACLRDAGRAWADRAGGTSGVLWGAGIGAVAHALAARPVADPAARAAAAARAGVAAVVTLGGAKQGDKTMVDAAEPFAAALEQAAGAGQAPAAAWDAALEAARTAAQATADLRPRLGRARPLAERSVGTPDPGAVSFAAIVAAVRSTVVPEGEETP